MYSVAAYLGFVLELKGLWQNAIWNVNMQDGNVKTQDDYVKMQDNYQYVLCNTE